MATLQSITASNWPKVDSDLAEEILDQWDFIGHHTDLSVDVDDDESRLKLFGYCSFEPYPMDEVDHPDERYDFVDARLFLEEITEALEEPMIVQSICHEKCRFPLGGCSWIATPDGEVDFRSFRDHEDDVLGEAVTP